MNMELKDCGSSMTKARRICETTARMWIKDSIENVTTLKLSICQKLYITHIIITQEKHNQQS
jgi:hypothetical protein